MEGGHQNHLPQGRGPGPKQNTRLVQGTPLKCLDVPFQHKFIIEEIIIGYSIPIADIVFIVKDKPHPLFKREGNDLISKPEIPLVTVSNWIASRSDLELTNFFLLLQALTGGSIEISTLDGRKIRIPINEIVRYGLIQSTAGKIS